MPRLPGRLHPRLLTRVLDELGKWVITDDLRHIEQRIEYSPSVRLSRWGVEKNEQSHCASVTPLTGCKARTIGLDLY